jgi:hypothetical protein
LALDIAGDWAIVGAPGADIDGEDRQGEAYIFHREDGLWIENQRLTASDGDSLDFFGWSVGIRGDTAMIGAFAEGEGADLFRGAVYVFERIGASWVETQKLQSSDGDAQDHFGFSLSFDGGTLLVGAKQAGPGDVTGGAVYAFVSDGAAWLEQAKLFDPLTEPSDSFGSSVSLCGERALIGARSDGTGSAYTFVRSGETWTLEQKLEPSDPTEPSLFGWSVTLWGRTAAIGAPQKETDGIPQRGALYIFTLDQGTWSETQRIVPADTHQDSMFGKSAVMVGNTLLVGAELDVLGGLLRGVVFELRPDNGLWQDVQWFAAPVGQSLDNFGEALALDGERALVGNPDNVTVNPLGGTAWVFIKPPVFADGFESGDTSAWSVTVP